MAALINKTGDEAMLGMGYDLKLCAVKASVEMVVVGSFIDRESVFHPVKGEAAARGAIRREQKGDAMKHRTVLQGGYVGRLPKDGEIFIAQGNYI